jgi:GNAT superfamily N-acetyltransferase
VTIEERSLRLDPLGLSHDRAGFHCGHAALDRYIRQQAGQDSRRDLTRVFVAVRLEEPHRIVGYFTLSATSISPQRLPTKVSKPLPGYPIPAALIGRLAVNLAFQGFGMGRALLGRAVRMIQEASQTLAVKVVVVDPIDDRAIRFYRSFGFNHLEQGEPRMYLLLPIEESRGREGVDVEPPLPG